MRKFAAAAMAVAAGTAVLITPVAAHAEPRICKAGINRYMPGAPDKGSASCTSGDGLYRVFMTCSAKATGGDTKNFSGPYRVPGTRSSAATCGSTRPWAISVRVDWD